MTVIKAFNMFNEGYCSLEFLSGLDSFKAYKDSKGNVVVVLQFGENYNLDLSDVTIIENDGTVRQDSFTPCYLNIQIQYRLYEIVST